MQSYSLWNIFIGLLLSVHVSTAHRWESSHYVWNFGLIGQSTKGICKNPYQYFSQPSRFSPEQYHNLQAGDIVWLKCIFVPQFCKTIVPTLSQPIILLIADGDESFPSECGDPSAITELLNNPYIIHIFAQNNDYGSMHPKLTSIPIGIDLHTVAYKGSVGGWGERGSPAEQESRLAEVLQALRPTHARKKKAFVDFQLSDTMHGELNRYLKCGEDRRSIFEQLVPTGLIEYGSWMKRSALWGKKGEYAFSISPHGNGLDCHRTWEDLILGCIVIVKTSPLDTLYEGLPIVIVNDWSEITEAALDQWLQQYGDAFTNPQYREKLTLSYWLSKIHSVVQPPIST
jgi:hypothetical protein